MQNFVSKSKRNPISGGERDIVDREKMDDPTPEQTRDKRNMLKWFVSTELSPKQKKKLYDEKKVSIHYVVTERAKMTKQEKQLSYFNSEKKR
ncbi:MAG: hypothetical protein RR348_01955 [Clostridia bacterium]